MTSPDEYTAVKCDHGTREMNRHFVYEVKHHQGLCCSAYRTHGSYKFRFCVTVLNYNTQNRVVSLRVRYISRDMSSKFKLNACVA